MTEATPMIDRLTIIGVGLIGGSLARALKKAGQVGQVIGVSRGARTLETGLELGVIDIACAEPDVAVAQADVVVLATPVRAMSDYWPVLREHLADHAVVTDVGSVKGHIVGEARTHLGNDVVRFVPGHPIAGTEHSGVGASFAELFVDKRVILTPAADTQREPLALIERMWSVCGARVSSMPAERHDELLAGNSHLPHMVAYALVDYLATRPEAEELFATAAGLYDFTRIASSDPIMWRDICATNALPLADAVRGFRDRLDILLAAIENGDGETLQRCFARSKAVRDTALTSRAHALRDIQGDNGR